MDDFALSGQKVAILGGWYGLLAFLMLSRDYGQVLPRYDYIRSIDVDPNCLSLADMLLESWLWRGWKFKAMTADANEVDLSEFDIVINTAVEHFDRHEWFENLPVGTLVAVQSNDMVHDDHVALCRNLDDLRDIFAFGEELQSGEMRFDYVDWSFTRFMLMGRK